MDRGFAAELACNGKVIQAYRMALQQPCRHLQVGEIRENPADAHMT
jgi:hypothetical protein